MVETPAMPCSASGHKKNSCLEEGCLFQTVAMHTCRRSCTLVNHKHISTSDVPCLCLSYMRGTEWELLMHDDVCMKWTISKSDLSITVLMELYSKTLSSNFILKMK